RVGAGGGAGRAEAVRALNPAEFAKVRDPENPRRLVRAWELFKRGAPWPAGTERPRPELVGLRREPEDLRARVARRVRRMFADGLVEEVRELRRRWPELSETARHAIGYEEAGRVLDGTMDEEEAIAATALRTRQYAKRQMTWFRHQARVAWVDAGADEPLERVATRVERAMRARGRVGFAGL
ncbi:MAG: tRNA (adenosine(37)-N6)-dimethylallyltransferase MiaA, partial [Kiritimatiellae bacterium]|nr:tRNA (adenosine(37)-N6)-dimethylallyltransferase MiaA [Kiritimatiellia bacterium]